MEFNFSLSERKTLYFHGSLFHVNAYRTDAKKKTLMSWIVSGIM